MTVTSNPSDESESKSTGAPNEEDAKELLASTRTMAEKWSGAATGLTGLLGVSGTAFAGLGDVAELGVFDRIGLVALFLGALASSVVSLVACTGAAFGFPPLPGKHAFREENKKTWKTALAGRITDQERARKSVKTLWFGMGAAVIALSLSLIALGWVIIGTEITRG